MDANPGVWNVRFRAREPWRVAAQVRIVGSMRHLLPLPALLVLTAACESTGTPSDTSDPVDHGVQVGSEGVLVECDSEDVGRDATVPGFDQTPGEIADALLGDFAADLAGPVPANGTLGLVPTGYRATGAGCDPHVLVLVSGTLDLGTTLSSGDLAGGVAVDPAGAATLVLGSDAFTGALRPTFDPTGLDTVLRTDGAVLDGDGLEASLVFEGCAGADCQLDDLGSFTARRP